MSHVPDEPVGAQSVDGDPRGNRDLRGESLDTVFEVLAARRRRHTLYVLYRRGGTITVSDLADAVASSTGSNPARIVAELYHVHLPKLAAKGIVEYDRDDGTAQLADCSDRFGRYLTSAAADEDESLRRTSESATLSEF